MEKNKKKVKMSKVFSNQEEMTTMEAFHRVMRLRVKHRREAREKENKNKK